MKDSSSARSCAPPQDGDVLDLGDGMAVVVIIAPDGTPYLVLHIDGDPSVSATARAWADALEALVAARTDDLAAAIPQAGGSIR
ncbi:hypothetical protein BH10ACT1_BH10ACT1_33470 [soil metagenome]